MIGPGRVFIESSADQWYNRSSQLRSLSVCSSVRYRHRRKEASSLEYRRLPFEEYFINTSEDYNKKGGISYPVKYKAVKYQSSSMDRLLGILHEVNYEIHYEEERNAIQLNFQRTVGATDWFASVGESSVKYYDSIEYKGQPLQLRVHRGWADMYRIIKRDVRQQWLLVHEQYPQAETEILGWSLGSALAILCCQDLNYNFGLKSYLYTFGTVRPFKSVRSNAALMRDYLNSLYKECWNIADINDIISYLPPGRGFMMINRVDVGCGLGRSLLRLLNPYRYHTHYDRADLYAELSDTDGGKSHSY